MSEQKAKSSNNILLSSLYERAIADFASRRWETLINSTRDFSTIDETQGALVFFWSEYLNAVVCDTLFLFFLPPLEDLLATTR